MDQKAFHSVWIIAVISSFTLDLVPSLDVSVSVLFIYSTENCPRHPRHRHL